MLPGWSYEDILATPPGVLPVCIRLQLSRAQLEALPAQVVRDFQTILNYEAELKRGAQ